VVDAATNVLAMHFSYYQFTHVFNVKSNYLLTISMVRK